MGIKTPKVGLAESVHGIYGARPNMGTWNFCRVSAQLLLAPFWALFTDHMGRTLGVYVVIYTLTYEGYKTSVVVNQMGICRVRHRGLKMKVCPKTQDFLYVI